MPKFEGNPFVPDEELIRRTSKAVLHSAERGKRGLFEKMTAANGERIKTLMEQRPIFYSDKKEAVRIDIDPEIESALPEEFFADPTAWIESQSNIRRGYEEELFLQREEIRDLWDNPYDVTRVKEFTLESKHGPVSIVSKRLDRKGADQELEIARKAYDAGIPTPRVLGTVSDRGNLYGWFEKLNGISLDVISANQSDLLQFGYPVGYAMSEEEFENNLWKARGYFSAGEIDGAKEIWRRHLSMIRQVRLMWIVLNIIKTLQKDRRDDLDYYLESSSAFTPQEIGDALEAVGPFDSLRSLVDSFERLNSVQRGLRISTYQEKIWERERVLEDALKRERWPKVLDYYFEKSLFGYSIKEEKERLEVLCGEKGIRHKDFSNRNLVVDWEGERPRKGEDGKAKMWIIDWEPNPRYKK